MKKAFTLAEVLITLTIIGVIAALTIPNLMQKWQDAQTISGVKEAYSILDNAIIQTVRENGILADWTWPDSNSGGVSEQNSLYFLEKISQYVKFNKICDSKHLKECYSEPYNRDGAIFNFYKDLSGSILYYVYVGHIAILPNGMALSFQITSPQSTYWKTGGRIGVIMVDINGGKKPNRYGYDIFIFEILNEKNRLGIYDTRYISCANEGNCYRWIIKHGNVDYKYRDVSKEW